MLDSRHYTKLDRKTFTHSNDESVRREGGEIISNTNGPRL